MSSEPKSEKWIRIALIVLAGILAALLIVLFFQYQSLRRSQLIEGWHLRTASLLAHHAPLPVSSAYLIRPWMTFDYINRLFALPADYLGARLGLVAASGYPRVTIAEYAEKQNLDPTAFLNEVEDAVQGYVQHTASSTATTSPRPALPARAT